MDTVMVDDADEWSFNPFGGEIIDGNVCGRGSADMKGGLAASVYAVAAVKALGLAGSEAIAVSCSVMEEDYDGEALYYLCTQGRFKPENVIVCEPSTLKMALGHRGRALITIDTQGVAAHGSAPEKGVNAVYKMRPVISRVEDLSRNFIEDPGKKGSITLSIIESTAVSANAVPTKCRIFLDRRLALGEDRDYIEKELKELLKGIDAVWDVYQVVGKSWSGEDVILDSFLPAWKIESDLPLAKKGKEAYRQVFEKDPEPFMWEFSTNGVASAGRLGIPTIGLGPGDPLLAHKRDELCPLSEILKAAEFYAALCAV
jgi:putative selenium metabolism hydrolase